jgi:hypothetical protein
MGMVVKARNGQADRAARSAHTAQGRRTRRRRLQWGEWLRTAGKPKQARRGSMRISPSSAARPAPQSAHSSRGSADRRAGRRGLRLFQRAACATVARLGLRGAAGAARVNKRTALRFAGYRSCACFCPHPQPLSHRVGEGCRGERRFALARRVILATDERRLLRADARIRPRRANRRERQP